MKEDAGGAIDRIATLTVVARGWGRCGRCVSALTDPDPKRHHPTQARSGVRHDLPGIRRNGPMAVNLQAGCNIVVPEVHP